VVRYGTADVIERVGACQYEESVVGQGPRLRLGAVGKAQAGRTVGEHRRLMYLSDRIGG